jgi:L-threonylcarbamoyladenylate synthase
MDTRLLSTGHPDAIPAAEDVLARGGLVAFPTDTVYGLAALVSSEAGIARLYTAKERSTNKAIAVLIGEHSQLALLTRGLSVSAYRLAEAFWPGALTLVVPKNLELPAILSERPTIGVRMPDHPFARALMRRCGPLATTSANLSGESNALNANQVLEQLAGRVELVLDGGTAPGGVPSTVVDCTQTPPVILRQGAVSETDIFRIV